jgi:Predicted phosphoribosyltransferases
MCKADIHTLSGFKDRIHVFRDRAHAGEILAEILADFRGSDGLALAIPAGGVPVAEQIATRLSLDFDVLPVSKILFPWTTESGFGAVAFDGTEWLDEDVIKRCNLDAEMIRTATRAAREKVRRRLKYFRGLRPFPEMKSRTIILADDGIAAGSTMRAAILALQKAKAGKIILAIPTGHENTLHSIAESVHAIYCANVRGGISFAVADAYQHWLDVTEAEVMDILAWHNPGSDEIP